MKKVLLTVGALLLLAIMVIASAAPVMAQTAGPDFTTQPNKKSPLDSGKLKVPDAIDAQKKNPVKPAVNPYPWDGQTVFYSSRVRTLVDAVYDWSRFGTLPRAYKWIRDDLKAGRVTLDKLVDVTLKFGDVGTIRRMGALLEGEGVDEGLLERLERPLRPTSATIPFVPGKPKRGRMNRRWGVVINR